MGGHIIPQYLLTERITIKLELTGNSCLIFKFYSVIALRAHVRLSKSHCTREQKKQTPKNIFIANQFDVFNLVTKQ